MMYWVCDRECGTKIDAFNTLEEAISTVHSYEAEDKENNCYTHNFYAIEDDDYNTIWTMF